MDDRKATWYHRWTTRLTRTKSADSDVMETNLRRCLSTMDVTLLSIGHMVGSGVYVLTATVAKNMAGPAIVLAFAFSGVASFLSALCYAELGVRYPRSGSAYSYTYLALGEVWAFLVGWNVTLEHIIGSAAVARACSAYINSLAGGFLRGFGHLDPVAPGIVVAFVAFLSLGVRATSHLNNALSAGNLAAILTTIGVGAYFADPKNWNNFLPYGWAGVLRASASCFYAYVGFDSIASSGEEVRNPRRSIPLATILSMGVACSAYIGVSAVLTLMENYKLLADESGLPEALGARGASWAKIVVIAGALCGMASALIGTLFALTRVAYSLADDGLLFPMCARVNARTKIPLIAMFVFASLSALLAFTLDMDSLVEVMSIGTLFAYLVVAASVIVLRYRPSTDEDASACKLKILTHMDPNWKPGRLVTLSVFLYVASTFVLFGFIKGAFDYIEQAKWWAIMLLVVFFLAALLSLMVIVAHSPSQELLSYKVPLVPLTPALSIAINAVLIVNLKSITWLRMLIWVAIGFLIYFFYGVKHSKLETAHESTHLQLTKSPPPTWGSLEKENSIEIKDVGIEIKEKIPNIEKPKAKVSQSTSQEFLVDNQDVSP